MFNSTSLRRRGLPTCSLLLVGALAAGCTTTGGTDASTSNAPTDGTFTMAIPSDPQSLDPQMTLDGTSLTMSAFAYDSLVSSKSDGTFGSKLAASWTTNGNDWVFTLNQGVKCADGSTLTPDVVAANFDFLTDPKNASPLNGTYLAAGVKASADNAANTVTLTVPSDTQFFLSGLALVPIVCKAGLDDRKALATKTQGTGPYQLKDAAPGSKYSYVRSTGYKWGPEGASNEEPGSPATVNFQIVQSQSTMANLLLSGEINAGPVSSADQKRLKAQGLFSAGYPTPNEMFFNEGSDHVTSDIAVRKALTTALNLEEIRKIYTDGNGEAAKSFTPGNPAACPGDSISSALPKSSVSDAKTILDAAGWTAGPDGIRVKNGKKLTVSFLNLTGLYPGATPAAESAAQTWKEIGVDVQTNGVAVQQINNVLFGTGAWDVAWAGVGVSVPNQLVSVFQGEAPPKGANFAHLANEAYNAEVKLAKTSKDNNGCENWLKAETALVANYDVIPFATSQFLTYGSGATFDFSAGYLIPTSVRLQS